jgi:hypothetical protein
MLAGLGDAVREPDLRGGETVKHGGECPLASGKESRVLRRRNHKTASAEWVEVEIASPRSQ